MSRSRLARLALTLLCPPALACLPVLAGAAEPTPPPAPVADLSSLRTGADADALDGLQAMQEADRDPHRAVDAAIAFSRAIKAYSELGDAAAVGEMQADLFWCKKRMNLADLQEYLAKKGAPAQRDFAAAQAELAVEVPKEEAAAYLERADEYRAANPDKHFQVAIRYSEIVERFQGTAQATKAGAVFSVEQAAYLAAVANERKQDQARLVAERSQVRETRFMAPPRPAGKTAIPGKAAIDGARAALLQADKDDFAKAAKSRADAAKRALGRKLAGDAEDHRADPAAYWAELDEAEKLALAAEDYETLLDALERQGACFAGFDVPAAKRAALTGASSGGAAASILALLKNPADKVANLQVGKFYCYTLGDWRHGLPMLSVGGDPDLHQAAEMELGDPRAPDERRLTGDAWFELGRKASGGDRLGAWARAQFWYASCVQNLTGVARSVVEKNLDQIEKALPVEIKDYDAITERQWERLRGTKLVIEARVDRSDSGLTLAPGQRVRIVADPADKWKWTSAAGDEFACTAIGGTPDFPRPRGGRRGRAAGTTFFHEGEMSAMVGDGDPQSLGIIAGPGHLWIKPQNSWGLLGSGSIRVKIVAVEDE